MASASFLPAETGSQVDHVDPELAERLSAMCGNSVARVTTSSVWLVPPIGGACSGLEAVERRGASTRPDAFPGQPITPRYRQHPTVPVSGSALPH